MTDDAGPSAKVGYKRPPLHTRFTSGVSGNPRGRAEDREILEAYAEAIWSRPAGAAESNPVPDEGDWEQIRWIGCCGPPCARISPRSSARSSLPCRRRALLPNWHIDAIVYQLMRVHLGQSRRLLINQPPRSLKSICVSIAYVAWILGHDPTRRVIVVSYSADFAAELHRQFRMVINSVWYATLFPQVKWSKETGLELVTARGGGRYATSVGGTLTGRGADLIIVDDPLNATEAYSESARKRVIDWYGGTLVSRLNEKKTGSIIAVMQRLHEEDLAGHLREQGGWDCLDLPAIALEDEIIPLGYGLTHRRRAGDILHPDRESSQALEAIKAEIGSLLFSAQYQQRPTPPGGAMIKRNWVRRYSEPPQRQDVLQVIQSWDTAMKGGPANDWSVCTTCTSLDLVVAHGSSTFGPAGSSPIPEPSTWAMFALGFLGLGSLRLKGRRRAAPS